jgi:hypothetical protein
MGVVQWRDVVILVTLPIALMVIQLLPHSVRRAYAFDYTDPTFGTAFSANFVHLSIEHLLTNVLIYLLLAGIGYSLFVLADRRVFFLSSVFVVTVVFPVVLSYLNLVQPRNAIEFGFSGINMALLGLLPSGITFYAAARFSFGSTFRATGGVFLMTLAVVAVGILPHSLESLSIAAVAITGGVSQSQHLGRRSLHHVDIIEIVSKK